MLAIFSLGSCMGDSEALLRRAAALLEALPGARPAGRSSLYETDAIDVPPEFAGVKFLNAVVAIETDLPPKALSAAMHAFETALGRRRTGLRHEPRPIDIDAIAIGDAASGDPALTLPHPEASCRRFVMEPLAEIFPEYVLPGQSRAAREIADALAGQGVRRIARL